MPPNEESRDGPEDDYEDSYDEDDEEESDEYDEYDEDNAYSDEDEEDLGAGPVTVRKSGARGNTGAPEHFHVRPQPAEPTGSDRPLPRAASWPGPKSNENVGENQVDGRPVGPGPTTRPVLRRSCTDPNRSVRFSENPVVIEFVADSPSGGSPKFEPCDVGQASGSGGSVLDSNTLLDGFSLMLSQESVHTDAEFDMAGTNTSLHDMVSWDTPEKNLEEDQNTDTNQGQGSDEALGTSLEPMVMHTALSLGPSVSNLLGEAALPAMPQHAAPVNCEQEAGRDMPEGRSQTAAGVPEGQSFGEDTQDIPQPEHEPADAASVLEAKDEEDAMEDTFQPSMLLFLFDAEQPEGEPASLETDRQEPLDPRTKGAEYFEIGSDLEKESSGSMSSLLETPRMPGNGRSHLQPPSPLTQHFMIGSHAEEDDVDLSDRSDCEADGEDPFDTLERLSAAPSAETAPDVEPPVAAELQKDLSQVSFASLGQGAADSPTETDLGIGSMQAAQAVDTFGSGTPPPRDAEEQLTPEKVARKHSNKQMAAKMAERRRKIEGILPKDELMEASGDAVQHADQMSVAIEEFSDSGRGGFQVRSRSSGQPSVAVRVQKESAQHDAAQQNASETTASATRVQQIVQQSPKDATPQKSSDSRITKQASMTPDTAQAASAGAAMWGRRQPSLSDLASPERLSMDEGIEEGSAQHDAAQAVGSQRATQQSFGTGASVEKLPVGDAIQKGSVQHDAAQPDASEMTTIARGARQIAHQSKEDASQRDTTKQASIQSDPPQPASANAAVWARRQPSLSSLASPEKLSMDDSIAEASAKHGEDGLVGSSASGIQQWESLQASSESASAGTMDTTVAQASAKHQTACPVVPKIPISSIGVNRPGHGTQQPSIVQRGRGTLLPIREESNEPAIRHLSPPRVGHPLLESANTMPRVFQPSPKFGLGTPEAQPKIGRTGSLPEPHQRPKVGILKKAKTESFVEHPKILRFASEVEFRDISPCRPSSPATGNAAASSGPTRTLASHSGQPALSFHTLPAGDGDLDLMQRGRLNSLSLLPDLPSPSPSHGSASAQAAQQPQAFKVQIAHQQASDENRKRSQASDTSAFLVWKQPSACEPGHSSSSAVHPSSNGSEEKFHNPIATFAHYVYQMTQPSGPHMTQHPQVQNEKPMLKTTVNCTSELTEMYQRHSSHHRHKHHRHNASPSSPQSGGREKIPTSQREPGHARKVAYDRHGRLTPEFEQRVLERAYFQYISGVSDDEWRNYFEALRIELTQLSCRDVS